MQQRRAKKNSALKEYCKPRAMGNFRKRLYIQRFITKISNRRRTNKKAVHRLTNARTSQ